MTLKILSPNPEGNISQTCLHEFTHIISPTLEAEENPILARYLLNEGRACLIAHLLEPEQKLADVLMYTSRQVDWCRKNEPTLMKDLQQHSIKTNSETAELYFSPGASLLYPEGPRRLGYYLGYRLCQMATDNLNTPKAKIKLLLSLDTVNVIVELLEEI